MHATLEDWIRGDALSLADGSPDSFNDAVDRIVASLGDKVELLGFGEALHGGEEILLLRNRLFQRLATAHGYSAIAIESCFARGRLANDYVAGGPSTYDEIQDRGFSQGCGRLEANRELIEWMRRSNADPSRKVELRFHGFDIPGLEGGIASPGQVLRFATDYLSATDAASGHRHRQRIEPLLGRDGDWENPAIYADPTKSPGLSHEATALRIATEDLLTELQTRRPELVAATGRDRYSEGLQHALVARQSLNFHAALAGNAGAAAMLGIRDALMADNLVHLASRERPRGKTLAFAHNAHLQRGKAVWAALGEWWPAGAHLAEMLGPRYAAIGTGVGASDENGIGPAEAGSLEARLLASGTTTFILTHHGQGFPADKMTAITPRSGSSRNPSYGPLRPRSLTDFDCLAVLPSTGYARGMRPLPTPT